MTFRQLAAVVASTVGLRAAGQLAATSPFLPPASAQVAAAPTESLEFLGYLETSGGLQYRVRDSAQKTGVWLKLNERNPELSFVAKAHDRSRETLTVEQRGRSIVLPLRPTRTFLSGPAQPFPRPNSVALTTARGASSELEALAASVAQRRAARLQATPTPVPALPPANQSAPAKQP